MKEEDRTIEEEEYFFIIIFILLQYYFYRYRYGKGSINTCTVNYNEEWHASSLFKKNKNYIFTHY